MSGLRRQRQSLVAAIAFAAGVGVAAETRAQCATVVAQPVILAYNPLTAGAKTKIEKAGGTVELIALT